MAEGGSSTPPGAAEPAALYRRWKRILDDIDAIPARPDARQFRRLEAAEAVEREIVRTPSGDVAGVIVKLRMAVSGRVCAAVEGLLVGSAIRDLEGFDPATRIENGQ